MRVRFSTCIGISVLIEGDGEVLGKVADILIHPDRGCVEGFFVDVSGFFSRARFFLPTLDIIRFGTTVTVRSPEALGSLGDIVRLQPLVSDPRIFLHQRIRTEGGQTLGRCRDVQFSTDSWQVEWLFPRMFLRWGTALPISDVVEVRRRAIIVRDPPRTVPEGKEDKSSVIEDLADLAEGVVTPTTYK